MKKQSEKAKIFKTLKPYSKYCRGCFVVLFLLSIFSLGFTALQPVVFSFLLDKGLVAKNVKVFIICILIILAFFAVNKVTLAIMTWHTNKIVNIMSFHLKRAAYRKLLCTKYKEMERFKVSSIKMRLEDDIDGLGGFLISYRLDYIFHIMIILMYSVFVLLINPIMTLYLLPIIPVVCVINVWLGKRRAECYENQRVPLENSYNIAYQSIVNWKEIKAFGLEKRQEQSYMDNRHKIAKLNLKWIFYWGRGRAFDFFKSPIISNVLIYIVGSIFVLNGEVTIGVLSMFIQYFVGIFSSINVIFDREAELKTIAVNHNRLKEILDLTQTERLPAKNIKFDTIEMNNISFAYNMNSRNILSKLDLKLKKGEYLGIVGESGCGKSTLIKLLLNLYDVDGGEITYNQIALKEIDSNELYKSVSVVMQDSFLLNLSIADNLKFAKSNATYGEMKEACISAGIWELVKALPDGLNTVVGEHGVKLSGGQRQRICLAQALIRNPSILMLDEPTSSLDSQKERLILESIRKKKGEFTIVMIAHRKNSLIYADRVVEMKKLE